MDFNIFYLAEKPLRFLWFSIKIDDIKLWSASRTFRDGKSLFWILIAYNLLKDILKSSNFISFLKTSISVIKFLLRLINLRL